MSVYRCACACMCICVCMYACICACAYACIFIYVSVYMYAYTCICTRVWVYICTRVDAFGLFVLSDPSTTCVCIRFFNQHTGEVGDWKMGVLTACSWLAIVAGVGGYITTGVEQEFFFTHFSIFCGC